MENSPSLATAVAVIRLLGWINEERRGFLLMKWTDGPKLRSGSLKREIAADHRDDIRGGCYLFNGFLSDTRHKKSAAADQAYDLDRVSVGEFCRRKIGPWYGTAVQF